MRLDQIRLAVMARRENRFEGIARNIIRIIRGIIRVKPSLTWNVSLLTLILFGPLWSIMNELKRLISLQSIFITSLLM